MFAKITLGLAIALAIVSAASAAKRDYGLALGQAATQNVYNPAGANVGTDPDANIRFELRRDWSRGK